MELNLYKENVCPNCKQALSSVELVECDNTCTECDKCLSKDYSESLLEEWEVVVPKNLKIDEEELDKFCRRKRNMLFDGWSRGIWSSISHATIKLDNIEVS